MPAGGLDTDAEVEAAELEGTLVATVAVCVANRTLEGVGGTTVSAETSLGVAVVVVVATVRRLGCIIRVRESTED